jgi:hypothetical protein
MATTVVSAGFGEVEYYWADVCGAKVHAVRVIVCMSCEYACQGLIGTYLPMILVSLALPVACSPLVGEYSKVLEELPNIGRIIFKILNELYQVHGMHEALGERHPALPRSELRGKVSKLFSLMYHVRMIRMSKPFTSSFSQF